MDYEQKYKDALERARNLYKDAIDMGENIRAKQCEIIFPEIKSKDEKIRKALIDFFNKGAENGEQTNGVCDKDILVWLEKQGNKRADVEQAMKEEEAKAKAFTKAHKGESADEILAEMRGEDKHKFKIGDIISNGKVVYRVDGFAKNCVGEDSYFLVNVEMEKNGIRFTSVCDPNGTVHNAGEIMWICDQVDQMFQKVLVEKSEPAWSDVDESMCRYVINDLRFVKEIANDPNFAVNVEKVEEEINWLKSLKQRYTWKPSDEQLDALHDAAVYVDKSMFPHPKGILMKLYKQLKKLREG